WSRRWSARLIEPSAGANTWRRATQRCGNTTRPALPTRWRTWRNTSSRWPRAARQTDPSLSSAARRRSAMAAIRLLPSALEDLERLVEFLRDSDPPAAVGTANLIFQGLGVLAEHPLIGRPVQLHRRELLIFRGRTGYIAQYEYEVATNEVLVLAIRH